MNKTTPMFLLAFMILSFWRSGPVHAEDNRSEGAMIEDCEKNISHTCFRLGERYRTLDLDLKKALPYFVKACELGHMTGCSHAGIILMQRGTPYSKEFKQAKKYFQDACDQQHDKACYNLGSLFYKEGRQKKSIKYFEIACKLDNPAGCARAEKMKK